jgi:hypothetical protein
MKDLGTGLVRKARQLGEHRRQKRAENQQGEA